MAFVFDIPSRLSQITAILGFTFFSLLLSCEQQESTPARVDEPIVAQIGDRLITAKEFRNSYEVGFAHLKFGTDPRQSYLEYMIKEELLALKGYQLHFDQSQYVKNNERQLLNELMTESLLDREVKSKIKITPEEIRDEINKSKVTFKFRYWAEPTLEKANTVAADMRERGYAEVLDDIIHGNPERKIDPKLYETDYLTYLEVPEDVLNVIKDLPYGNISDPLKIDNKYFIFQVVDIRRSGITENEYKSRAGSFERILFYKKFQQEATRYIADLMESKNVVVKKEAFNLLANAINEWLEISPMERFQFQEQVRKATNGQPAMTALKENLRSTFFTCAEGKLSIEEFFDFFNESRLFEQSREGVRFGEALNQETKNAIRDYFLVQRAKQMNLQREQKVDRELNLWRDKWVFDETRRYLVRNLKLNENEIKSYFSENKNHYKINKEQEPSYTSFKSKAREDLYRYQTNLILEKQVESLKKLYPVIINNTVLDTITVTDFDKPNRMNIQIFKGGTNRPAFPTVDPFWESSK
jgi:hypothetical protein